MLNMAKLAVLRMAGDHDNVDASNTVWLLDKDERKFIRHLLHLQEMLGRLKALEKVPVLLKWFKKSPCVILGLSGVGGIFNEEVLRAMKRSDSPPPAIFAMSNPTPNGDGKIGHANQANNMYLFPGIGLGALLSGAQHITDGMLQAAAECSLASYMTEEEIEKGILFPSISSIGRITTQDVLRS